MVSNGAHKSARKAAVSDDDRVNPATRFTPPDVHSLLTPTSPTAEENVEPAQGISMKILAATPIAVIKKQICRK